MATSILASLANWQFVLCHFPSVLGISYILIPRKLAILPTFKYWSYITSILLISNLVMFCLAQKIAKMEGLLYSLLLTFHLLRGIFYQCWGKNTSMNGLVIYLKSLFEFHDLLQLQIQCLEMLHEVLEQLLKNVGHIW